MEDFDKIITFEEALEKLDRGLILSSIIQNKKTIFIKKGEKVIMKNNNLGLALSLNDFKSIFENSEFVLIKNDEEFVDVQRDIEYYSWRNK